MSSRNGNFTNLSTNTLYEFLRNSGAQPGVHPVHRQPWIPPVRRNDNDPFNHAPRRNGGGGHRLHHGPVIGRPLIALGGRQYNGPVRNSGSETQLTVLQRLAAERREEVVKPKPVKRSLAIDLDRPIDSSLGRDDGQKKHRSGSSTSATTPRSTGAPPPMFENPTKTRGTRLSHIKGTSPQQLAKYRSMNTGSISSLKIPGSGMSSGKILTIDDLHRSVLGVDFSDLENSCAVDLGETGDVQLSYDSLDAYKQRQSQALLVEVMEGFRKSLETGFVPQQQQSSQTGNMYSTVNVRVTTCVRKGREFCLLTLKRDSGESGKDIRSTGHQVQNTGLSNVPRHHVEIDGGLELTQGDVVLLLRPKSSILT
jgi:hypothetical protein